MTVLILVIIKVPFFWIDVCDEVCYSIIDEGCNVSLKEYCNVTLLRLFVRFVDILVSSVPEIILNRGHDLPQLGT